MNSLPLRKGDIPPDPVAPDSLRGIPRQQTNPKRWEGDGWGAFVEAVRAAGVEVREERAATTNFVTDAGGLSYGLPHGVVRATTAMQIAVLLQNAQKHRVPVTCRGGGLTTEGESVAYGGVLLDMTGMSRVLWIDDTKMQARVQGGIFWHSFAEVLRRQGLDYVSAPLNFTSSVGGTLGVGGIDVNSPKWGCSADHAVALQVVTPTGEIVECSENHNRELFERVLLGYGQFGVIAEATMKIRPFTPISMHYFYYPDLRTAIEDLQWIAREDASDYSGILTMLDRAVNLLVAFDSDEKEKVFFAKHRGKLRGHGEIGFAARMARHYATHPWQLREAAYLYGRKRALMPEFSKKEFLRADGKIVDRTVVFSRAVWKFWGARNMVIPDLATNEKKFADAVERGNAICRKYFPHYTLYCVGIKLKDPRPDRYELSSIPADADGMAWGCEFEPMIRNQVYSRDYLQSFKNEIYDVGVDMKTSYYRFGGSMRAYVRRVFGDALVDKHLALKRAADPAMILNPDVVF